MPGRIAVAHVALSKSVAEHSRTLIVFSRLLEVRSDALSSVVAVAEEAQGTVVVAVGSQRPPLYRLLVALSCPDAVGITNAKSRKSLDIATRRCVYVIKERLGIVPLHAITLAVSHAYGVQGVGVLLVRRLAPMLKRLGIVLFHAVAVVIGTAQSKLGFRTAVAARLDPPLARLAEVAFHSVAIIIGIAERGLGFGVSVLSLADKRRHINLLPKDNRQGCQEHGQKDKSSQNRNCVFMLFLHRNLVDTAYVSAALEVCSEELIDDGESLIDRDETRRH